MGILQTSYISLAALLNKEFFLSFLTAVLENDKVYFESNYYRSMQLIKPKLMSAQIQSLITNKVEQECFLCMGQFNQNEYAPVIMCINQHSCCAPCMKELIKNDANKPVNCPQCSQPISKKALTKNRYLITLFQIIDAYNRYVSQLHNEVQSLKKMTNIDSKASLLAKQSKLVISFILGDRAQRNVKESSLFDDFPTSRSQTWIGCSEKRRQNLLAYAQRQKIEQLKKIANTDVPLEQVHKIRSGYGTIKKIECMQYFINLKELLLYNNHIRIIQGLNNNIKLNVLSLAYNKIEKAENLGHLKELKRLSLECNKLGRSSAEYLTLYQWKNLESLTISFHEEKKEENEQCLQILFTGRSSIQWSSLKTLYLYNSKCIGEKTRALVKEFVSKKKSGQVYWS